MNYDEQMFVDLSGPGENRIQDVMDLYHQELQKERERHPSDLSYLTNNCSVNRHPNYSTDRCISSLVNFSDLHVSECGREETHTRVPNHSRPSQDLTINADPRADSKADSKADPRADPRADSKAEPNLDRILKDRLDLMIREHETGLATSWVRPTSWNESRVITRDQPMGERRGESSQVVLYPQELVRRYQTDSFVRISNPYVGKTRHNVLTPMDSPVCLKGRGTSNVYERFIDHNLSQQSLQMHNELSKGRYRTDLSENHVAILSTEAMLGHPKIPSGTSGWDTYLTNDRICNDGETDHRTSVANFHKLISFMRAQSCDESKGNDTGRKKRGDTGTSDRESLVPQFFQSEQELLWAGDRRGRLMSPVRNNNRTKSEQVQRNRTDTSINRNLKTYTLEDIRSGKEEMPRVILLPSDNRTGCRINGSYKQNPNIEQFMKQCNDSVHLLLKYPKSSKSSRNRTLNVPVGISHLVNSQIGQPIIYQDQFDRNEYHPNVTNLHMGPVFEKHVFGMMKNKKDLKKSVFKESVGFSQKKYDPKNGFWISNISKDRLVEPEMNNSYITELVYEKKKSYEEEMEAMKKSCDDIDTIVPSIMDHYKNNNFFQFIVSEELYKFNAPQMATIMRRFDLGHIGGYKAVDPTPLDIPVPTDMAHT